MQTFSGASGYSTRGLDAGALNKRIKILRKANGTDTHGYPVEGWPEVATVWANVTAAAAREFWEAQAAHGELTHKITIRYRPDITADMRIAMGDRNFELVAPPVDYNERHEYLVLKCREVTT